VKKKEQKKKKDRKNDGYHGLYFSNMARGMPPNKLQASSSHHS